MSFKTCPHCGMRLTPVDDDFLTEEDDLEDRILFLLQQVNGEYLEEALEVSREIIECSCDTPDDFLSGVFLTAYDWNRELSKSAKS